MSPYLKALPISRFSRRQQRHCSDHRGRLGAGAWHFGAGLRQEQEQAPSDHGDIPSLSLARRKTPRYLPGASFLEADVRGLTTLVREHYIMLSQLRMSPCIFAPLSTSLIDQASHQDRRCPDIWQRQP